MTSGMWRGRGLIASTRLRQVCTLSDNPEICRMSRGSLFFFSLETFDARDIILHPSKTPELRSAAYAVHGIQETAVKYNCQPSFFFFFFGEYSDYFSS
jgi:hypothetical protein